MAISIEIARVLRHPIDNATAIIPPFAALQMDGFAPSTILHFIQRALDHQDKVQHEDSKVFPATIVDVKRVTRESNGKPLGKKAVIVMETTDSKGKAQDPEEISTHWVEFLGESDPDKVRDPSLAWEIAQSRSIEDDATALIGRKAFVRKAFIEAAVKGGGTRVRFLADVMPDFRDAGPDEGKGATGAATSDAMTVGDIKDMCEKLGAKYKDDLDDLTKVKSWSGSREDVAERVAKAARIHKDEEVDEFIDVFVGTDGVNEERAILTLVEWR
jgi:hypothetical protein